MRNKIALAAAAVLVAAAVVVAFVATRPRIHRAERSVLVEAPPQVVLAQITDPKRWVAWSPWEGGDVGVRRTYGGAPEGEGASYYWSGNDRMGQGRLTIIRASGEQVEVERELEKPSPSLSDFEFRLAPEGAGTRLRWLTTTESGGGGLRERARALLAGRNEPAGADMERGLARLKAAAEAQAKGERWRVQRSALVAAPPPAVLAQIVDLHRWAAWSPWERASMRRAYGGAVEGPGASCYWSSDAEVGQGRLTIIAASLERVMVEMELPGPRQLLADIEFRLAPEGDGSRVTWAIAADLVPGEALGRAGEPEATIGPDLEKGLARLTALVEAEVKVHVAK